jgi:hypothetical protein
MQLKKDLSWVELGCPDSDCAEIATAMTQHANSLAKVMAENEPREGDSALWGAKLGSPTDGVKSVTTMAALAALGPEPERTFAQDGVKDVTTDYAQAAGALGAVAEKTFDVEQTHIKDKKVKKRVQLRVGGQGIMLFDGPKFLGSNTYSRMAKSWNLNTNKHTITIHPDPDSVKAFGIMSFVLVCVNQDEREVSDTMMAHASKIR